MSDSPLVDYVKISPNKSERTAKINAITIHHMAGNLTVERCGEVFAPASRKASSNYGVGTDGRIGMYVNEKYRSWCSSSQTNDNRAVTIEVANDGAGPDWHVSDKALAATIDLCVDICKRNGIEKLNYTGNAKGNLTMHRWFASTLCPGPYLASKFPYIAEQVNKRLAASETVEPSKPSTTPEPISGTQAKIFKSMTNEQVIATVGPLFTADQNGSGVLASVSLAQFILESGYGKAELPVNANNCFSMKTSLSGNNWPGSTWDGKSAYDLATNEYYNGAYHDITAAFRKYASVEQSIADHSAYLTGAKNGSKLRYDGLKGCTDYKKAIQIIKDGGYATDPNYVSKLCRLIEQYGLTKYDVKVVNGSVEKQYLVKIEKPGTYIYTDAGFDSAKKTEMPVGTYTIVEEKTVVTKWGKLKSGQGWIPITTEVEKPVVESTPVKPSEPEKVQNYLVQVKRSDLNIRKGPGTNYSVVKVIAPGVYTIVQESKGTGSTLGWGKLKSGEGWISLDYATKV